MPLPSRDARLFAGICDRIADDRVRYFYMMLGDALAEATATPADAVTPRTNAGPRILADIQQRINAKT